MKKEQIYIVKTLELFKKNMGEIDFCYDIYFRIAVIEEYFKGNNEIWELYNQMQKERVKQIKFIPTYMSNHQEKFIQLINSIKVNGLLKDYPLLVNKDYMIMDGAHRMACALYFNLDNVYIKTTNEFLNLYPSDYTKEWFEKNNLSKCIYYAEKQKKKIKELL